MKLKPGELEELLEKYPDFAKKAEAWLDKYQAKLMRKTSWDKWLQREAMAVRPGIWEAAVRKAIEKHHPTVDSCIPLLQHPNPDIRRLGIERISDLKAKARNR